jgi:hypothetical protein
MLIESAPSPSPPFQLCVEQLWISEPSSPQVLHLSSRTRARRYSAVNISVSLDIFKNSPIILLIEIGEGNTHPGYYKSCLEEPTLEAQPQDSYSGETPNLCEICEVSPSKIVY